VVSLLALVANSQTLPVPQFHAHSPQGARKNGRTGPRCCHPCPSLCAYPTGFPVRFARTTRRLRSLLAPRHFIVLRF
jgi:hypothetical protein